MKKTLKLRETERDKNTNLKTLRGSLLAQENDEDPLLSYAVGISVPSSSLIVFFSVHLLNLLSSQL